MKKIRKNQKRFLLVLLIAVVVIITIVFIIKNVNKRPGGTEMPETPETPQITELPETTYSGMEVKNVTMELKKENTQYGADETDITFNVYNTTENIVENKFFTIVLIDSNDNEIARMPGNRIEKLEVGEMCQMSSICEGDMTATTQIKLIEE